MAASVVGTAERRGHAPEDVRRIARSVSLAMETRIRTLDDDHHPAYLHPGRSALVLLGDVPDAPASSVTLAAIIESRDAELQVDPRSVGELLGDDVATARAQIPGPGAEDLVERLVTLEPATALAALAERLDHLRHEHLREPTVPWIELLEEVERAWLPVAARTSRTLARRYAHWLRTFRHRL